MTIFSDRRLEQAETSAGVAAVEKAGAEVAAQQAATMPSGPSSSPTVTPSPLPARPAVLTNKDVELRQEQQEEAERERCRSQMCGKQDFNVDLSLSFLRCSTSSYLNLLRSLGIRSSLCSPIVVGRELYGVIVSQQAHTDKHPQKWRCI